MHEFKNVGGGKEGTPSTDSSAELVVKLSSNKTFEKLYTRLRTTPVDWNYVISQIDSESYALRDPKTLSGMLGETHVNHVLQQAANSEEYQQLLNLKPIPDEKETPHYRFNRAKDGRFLVYDLNKRRNVGEYDILMKVGNNNLVVAGEVKITNRWSSRGARHAGEAIMDTIKPTFINRLLRPLQEDNPQTNTFGYMVVTVPDAIKNNSPLLKLFRESGGILVTLPATHADFRDRAEMIYRINRSRSKEITIYDIDYNSL